MSKRREAKGGIKGHFGAHRKVKGGKKSAHKRARK